MTKDANSINKELADYCKNNGVVADEYVFNIGVRLGRLLEKQNLPTTKLAYFDAKDKEDELFNSMLATSRKIDGIFDTIVKSAIKEQIENNGDWEVGYGGYYSNYGKLDDDIAQKYLIQHISTDQPDRHGDFEAHFEVLGDVAKIFKKHQVMPRITAGVTNHSGDDSEAIRDVEDVNHTLYNIGPTINIKASEFALKHATELLEKLSKHYMFTLLKS